MPDDRRLSIGSTSRVGPDDVARHTFATSRRGFEPSEVRSYLESVARELQAAALREQELLDALTTAQQKVAHPVLDEGTLTAALGQETAKVLQSAHDAAAELLAKAEAEVTRIRSHVQAETEELSNRAEQHATERGTQAEAAANEIRRRAQEEGAARLEAAKAEAEAQVSQARAECRAMVQEAQELRARVLADLTRRRRVLHTQIEQLRAGRERLAETISATRMTVERVTDDLFRAEDEARLAAEVAGRQSAAQYDDDEVMAAEAENETTVKIVASDEPSDAPSEPGTSNADIGPEVYGTDEEGHPTQAVEELFARLRAEQRPAPTAAHEAHPAQELAGETVPEPGPSLDPALARRNEVLGPVVAGLARRLKRTMQDDQNDILDRLRAAGQWAPSVLPDEDEHKQRYVRAAMQHLDDAARAGAVFAGATADDAPAVSTVAADLASAIVVPLRRRLNGESAQAHQGDELALVEHVGSAYREWKGNRVERVAADEAHAAFAQAVVAATPKDRFLQWIVDDDGVQCPDCDDNALAGLVLSGEAFPTGHVFPPAHAGCRCLLVPASA